MRKREKGEWKGGRNEMDKRRSNEDEMEWNLEDGRRTSSFFFVPI